MDGFGLGPLVRSVLHMIDSTPNHFDESNKQGLGKRLSGTAFLSKAPPELVASTQQSLAEKKEQLATIQRSMEELGA